MAFVGLGFFIFVIGLLGMLFVGVDFVVWCFYLSLVVSGVLKLLSLPETHVLHLFSESEDLVSFQVFLKSHFILAATFISNIRVH